MAKRIDDPTHAKLVIQMCSLLALVILSGIDAASPTFAVDRLVYALIGGILFGVGGLRELLSGGKDDKK